MKFLIKNFSYISLLTSIFLFVYTFYKSEIHWKGTMADFYSVYYIIFIILLFLSIFSFFLKEKIKEYLVIIIISTIFGLYFFEGYLVFDKIKNIKSASNTDEKNKKNIIKKKIKIYEKNGNKYDTRSKLEVYKDLKKENSNISLSSSPYKLISQNTGFFHFSGTSFAKTVYCNENGYWSTYDSDRYGFNNPDEEWDSNEIEYLLIGDSFVKGACVNRPHDISSVLRNLSNKSILNLGVDGAGPLIEYAALREYLDSKVKKVVWIYYEGNDAAGLNNELKLLNLKNYLQDLNFTQNLKANQKKINKINEKLISFEEMKILNKNKQKKISIKIDKKQELLQFLKLKKIRMMLDKFLPYKYRQVKFSSSYDPKPKIQPSFKGILQQTKDLVSKNKAKLYFVYLPEYNRYKNDEIDQNYLEIREIVKELDIPLIDINEKVFALEPDPLNLFPFGFHGHYNIDGYKRVAEEIYKISTNK